MKKVFAILFAAGIIAMVACGSGAEQKTEAPATDSGAATTEAPAAADTNTAAPATADTTQPH